MKNRSSSLIHLFINDSEIVLPHHFKGSLDRHHIGCRIKWDSSWWRGLISSVTIKEIEILYHVSAEISPDRDGRRQFIGRHSYLNCKRFDSIIHVVSIGPCPSAWFGVNHLELSDRWVTCNRNCDFYINSCGWVCRTEVRTKLTLVVDTGLYKTIARDVYYWVREGFLAFVVFST